MSAVDHLQLRLFMPAYELAAMHSFEGEDWPGGQRGMKQYKLEESKKGTVSSAWKKRKKGEESFYDNVRREGVKEPVELGVFEDNTHVVTQGNHRVAVANAVNPQSFVPVSYYSNYAGKGPRK